MTHSIRLGLPSDAPVIAKHLCRAGGGLMDYLLDGVVPDVEADQLLAVNVAEENTALSYENAVVVETNDGVQGVLLAYPFEEFNISSTMEMFVPKEKLDHVRELYAHRLDDSFYVHALSVDEALNGQGIGRAFLDLSYEMAEDRGFSTVSLHVWKDNQRALSLYQANGFVGVEDIAIDRHALIPHDGGMLLMMRQLG